MRSILSAVWVSGNLGAAFYDPDTSRVFLVPDIADGRPDFDVLKLIIRQVNPAVTIVSCRQDDRFMEVIRSQSRKVIIMKRAMEIADDHSSSLASTSGEHSSSSGSIEGRPDGGEEGFDLLILPGRDFAPDRCKARLQMQRLPEEPAGRSDKEHLLYIGSVVPFSSERMVRACGALLMFLDKNASSFNVELVSGAVPVLDISVWKTNDLVIVDDNAWVSLQIFSSECHPAGSKQVRSCREGFSVYNLFNKCLTIQGSKYLRVMLSRPTRNSNFLKRRHDVVEYFCNPMNLEFVKNVSECLKGIKSLPALLTKISLLHASYKDWREFYNSVYQCVALIELVERQPDTIEVFAEISERRRSRILKFLAEEMMSTIDFNESKNQNRFYPSSGIDTELDRMRKKFAALPTVMSDVAAAEIRTLPEFVEQCTVVYLPEVGYLLGLSHWEEGLTEEGTELDGLDLVFSENRIAYYRSQRTREMDAAMGDLTLGMVDAETSIMISLTQAIVQHKAKILEIASLTSELDCLLAIASVASEFNFVRPTILPAGEILEIKDGRHPLVAVMTTFVPNSTLFQGDERIAILTGPNASGKSIYMKQVGITVLMALCGSFVPASAARIPVYDRIATRIHSSESISMGLSTFMIDINQMAMSLRSTTGSSLVLIDEFGKGTADADGLGLLVASLENFLERDQECPTVFLTTHFYSLMEYLQPSARLKMQTMQFTQEGDQIVYLYKLMDGVCGSSFAHLVARSAGVEESVIQRSLKVEDVIQRQIDEAEIIPRELSAKETLLTDIGRQLLSESIDYVSADSILDRVISQIAPFRAEDVVEVDRSNSPEVDHTPASRILSVDYDRENGRIETDDVDSRRSSPLDSLEDRVESSEGVSPETAERFCVRQSIEPASRSVPSSNLQIADTDESSFYGSPGCSSSMWSTTNMKNCET